MTDKMGTMFECLHRALEDKNVGSAKTDIEAEFCCVGLEHSTSRTAWRLTIYAGSGLMTITSEKEKKCRTFMSLCYTRD